MYETTRMSNLRKDYAHIPEVPTYRPVSISVCTSAPESNVRGFMVDLANELGEKIREVRYQQLPYNEVERFSFKDRNIDVMILCHSIHNRRFSVTDVMDSVYTQFLPKAAKELGKEKVGVIVHDLPREKVINDHQYEMQMATFRNGQPTTFRSASLVQLSGQLDASPVELGRGSWSEIKDFVAKASRVSEEPPAKALRKSLPCGMLILLVMIAIALAIGLGVGLTR